MEVQSVAPPKPVLQSPKHDDKPALGGLARSLLWLVRVPARLIRVPAYALILGASLLPLAALLLILPAFVPQETVLSDSIRPATSWWRRVGRRIFAVLTGLAMLIALLAFATELVTLLHLKSPYFGELLRRILPDNLAANLPRAMVDQWHELGVVVEAAGADGTPMFVESERRLKG